MRRNSPPLSRIYMTTHAVNIIYFARIDGIDRETVVFATWCSTLNCTHRVLNTPLRPRADSDSTVCRFCAFWPRLNACAGVWLRVPTPIISIFCLSVPMGYAVAWRSTPATTSATVPLHRTLIICCLLNTS